MYLNVFIFTKYKRADTINHKLKHTIILYNILTFMLKLLVYEKRRQFFIQIQRTRKLGEGFMGKKIYYFFCFSNLGLYNPTVSYSILSEIIHA